jgi:hypothetical protein
MNEIQDKVCSKCGCQLVRGYIPDFSYGAVFTGAWVEGAPKIAFLTGVKAPKKSDRIPIGAFRCRACGLLEFYADQRFSEQ